MRRAREGGSYHVEVSLTRCSMWLQDIGCLPGALWPASVDIRSAVPEPRAIDLMTSDSVFGELVHARPIVDFSLTKARWDRGPSPPGSAPLRWIDQ